MQTRLSDMHLFGGGTTTSTNNKHVTPTFFPNMFSTLHSRTKHGCNLSVSMRSTVQSAAADATEDLTVTCVNGKSKEAYIFISPCRGSDAGASCTFQVFRFVLHHINGLNSA